MCVQMLSTLWVPLIVSGAKELTEGRIKKRYCVRSYTYKLVVMQLFNSIGNLYSFRGYGLNVSLYCVRYNANKYKSDN